MLVLGRDHPAFGAAHVEETSDGSAACFLSVGADPDAPSMAYKGSTDVPNEDAVLVIDEGRSVLLAVADGHRGTAASHAVLEGLARGPVPPDPLKLDRALGKALAHAIAEASGTAAGTALAVVVLDRLGGTLFGRAIGDCSAYRLRGGRGRAYPVRTGDFFYPSAAEPLPLARFTAVADRVAPGDLVLLHTDGVDGCHYGHPRTSVRPEDVEDIATAVGPSPVRLVDALGRLALAGVEGAPGGQDNIAIAAARS